MIPKEPNGDCFPEWKCLEPSKTVSTIGPGNTVGPIGSSDPVRNIGTVMATFAEHDMGTMINPHNDSGVLLVDDGTTI